MRRRTRVGSIASLVAMSVLAGCSSGAPPESPPTPGSTRAFPVGQSPTSATTSAGPVATTIHAKDSQGYTFDIIYAYDLGAPLLDPTNDAPGKATIVFPKQKLTMRLVNTTPSRALKFAPDLHGPQVLLAIARFTSSAACGEKKSCTLRLGTMPLPASIPAGGSAEAAVTPGLCYIYEVSARCQVGVINVDETQAPTIAQALRRPDSIFFRATTSTDYFSWSSEPTDHFGGGDIGLLRELSPFR